MYDCMHCTYYECVYVCMHDAYVYNICMYICLYACWYVCLRVRVWIRSLMQLLYTYDAGVLVAALSVAEGGCEGG